MGLVEIIIILGMITAAKPPNRCIDYGQFLFLEIKHKRTSLASKLVGIRTYAYIAIVPITITFFLSSNYN